ATFAAADVAGYVVSEGSLVAVDTSVPADLAFVGNGDNDGDGPSRFQFMLEGIDSFETRWQGGTNSGFGFDGDGDYTIQPPACSDFGDAPNSYGTTLADDGPRHTLTPGLLLGAEIDFDADGQPNPAA